MNPRRPYRRAASRAVVVASNAVRGSSCFAPRFNWPLTAIDTRPRSWASSMPALIAPVPSYGRPMVQRAEPRVMRASLTIAGQVQPLAGLEGPIGDLDAAAVLLVEVVRPGQLGHEGHSPGAAGRPVVTDQLVDRRLDERQRGLVAERRDQERAELRDRTGEGVLVTERAAQLDGPP